MNLPQRLTEVSLIYPDKEAVIYREHRITYRELNLLVNKLINGFKSLGIKKDDRVVIFLPNCLEFVISYYAILRMEAVAVPLNPQYSINELSVILSDSSPKAVITNEDGLPAFRSLNLNNEQKPYLISTSSSDESSVLFNNLIEDFEPVSDVGQINDEQVAVLLYTSGTTGIPKGAMLTHKNLYSNVTGIAQCLQMQTDDRLMLVAPAYHAAAQTGVMSNAINVGATLVIRTRWQGPKAALAGIEEEKITVFFGPPIFYVMLCNYPQYNEFDYSSLRLALCGAAPLSEQLFKRFKEMFNLEIVEGYGMSEASPVVALSPYTGKKKLGSVGLPLPGVEVKIFDDNDCEAACEEIGEIVVKGPNVMKGYYRKDEETQAALKNGWLHTGDLGYIDAEGYIYIVDRKKDTIIRGGVNIYPREIEEVLLGHSDILETAVVGIADELTGEEVKAYYVTRSGQEISKKELREFCKGKIANFKIPKLFERVEMLPKNAAGKVLKRKLAGKV